MNNIQSTLVISFINFLQLGQYIFNLPEQLLPFMDPSEDGTPTHDQSDGLVECLRHGGLPIDFPQGHTVSANRSRLTSLSTSPPQIDIKKEENSAVITAWLDWLLAGRVSEAFVKAILDIPSPIPTNGKPIPGLTDHGAKQLTTDLGK